MISQKRKIFIAAKRSFRQTGLDLNTLLVPLSALVALLFLRPYLERLLQTPDSSSRGKLVFKKQRPDDIANEPSPLDKQASSHHGLYITDNEIDFKTNVAGCKESLRPGKFQPRKQPERKITFDAVFLICSAVQNVMRRRISRYIYGNIRNTRPYTIKIVFLVGLSKNSETEAQIRNESLKYEDILQGNFVDHYFNLSYKTIMGYRWAQLHCRNIKLVCKVDDDVFVDIFKFFNYFLPIISIRQRAPAISLNEIEGSKISCAYSHYSIHDIIPVSKIRAQDGC
ncbi:hypothetical protein RRG08_005427 [Elysia crispata]|uniref:Hexosyltransferase n=1 Tax=Elysia crispata TaxID=231223 RepID=A0AAE1CQU8_9GAST|nr:hypothetical protein RRG08_005427 [Elysia crispata]